MIRVHRPLFVSIIIDSQQNPFQQRQINCIQLSVLVQIGDRTLIRCQGFGGQQVLLQHDGRPSFIVIIDDSALILNDIVNHSHGILHQRKTVCREGADGKEGDAADYAAFEIIEISGVCSVTYENGRQRQDVWSKREWEAPEPGAGAGEPVVLTKEQVAALQKEKQLSYLTGGVKHGKLNAEEKIFLDRILADPEMEPKYRQILMDRFCSGSEIAQKAFNRFVPAESVANKSYSGIAHYVHNGNRIIWMNYSRDLKPGSSWLPGSTWFHEHGHLIDDYANRGTGLLSSHHPQFYDALKSNFVKLIQAQSQGAAIKNYEDALEYILNNTKLQLSFSSDLMKSKAQQESVSDIIEGLSDSYIRGCGGHNSSGIRPNSPKDDYWGEGKEREIIISAEAAAHMFEAQFDDGRYNQMKMYFPNALRIYEDMLKEVVS